MRLLHLERWHVQSETKLQSCDQTPGEKHAWKYNLSVGSADYKCLKIRPGSKLPEDINEDVWQIDVVTDTTQIDRVIYAIEWYFKKTTAIQRSDAQ